MKPDIVPTRGVFKTVASNSGFTAVELLALLLLLAVSAAVLTPGLSLSRNRSQVTVCRNNLERLMVGVNLYATDHDGYFPAPGWGLSSASWAASTPFQVGPAFSPETISSQINALKQGQIYSYVNSVNTYRCPADGTNSSAQLSRFKTRSQYISSYVMNATVCLNGTLADGKSIRQTSVPVPDAIVMWEADDKIPFYFNDFSSYGYEGISGRHAGFGFVGSLSGGAEAISLQNYYALAANGSVTINTNRLLWFKN